MKSSGFGGLKKDPKRALRHQLRPHGVLALIRDLLLGAKFLVFAEMDLKMQTKRRQKAML